MATLTLRGCDDELSRILKETSARRGVSVNRMVLEILRDSLIGHDKKPPRYDDLDHLAGTWSVADAAAFDKATEDFERVDSGDWD